MIHVPEAHDPESGGHPDGNFGDNKVYHDNKLPFFMQDVKYSLSSRLAVLPRTCVDPIDKNFGTTLGGMTTVSRFGHVMMSFFFRCILVPTL